MAGGESRSNFKWHSVFYLYCNIFNFCAFFFSFQFLIFFSQGLSKNDVSIGFRSSDPSPCALADVIFGWPLGWIWWILENERLYLFFARRKHGQVAHVGGEAHWRQTVRFSAVWARVNSHRHTATKNNKNDEKKTYTGGLKAFPLWLPNNWATAFSL